MGANNVPDAAVARLPLYLQALNGFLTQGTELISSDELAEACGISSSNVRKDLSYIGSYGTRGVGYETRILSENISATLGLSVQWKVAIVGAGNLGRALAGYAGFESRGFEVVALLDSDQAVFGSQIGKTQVCDVANLEQTIAATGANMAVLAVPAAAAAHIAQRIVACGISSILSFSPAPLQVPPHVYVRAMDMATELQILSYHSQRLLRDD